MKKLFIPAEDYDVSRGWLLAAQRIGVEVTLDIEETPYVLPLTDASARRFSAHDGINFIATGDLDRVVDRVNMQSLTTMALPVVLPTTPSDIEALSGPLFVKQRVTPSKSRHPLAYTTHADAAALLAALPDGFWEAQSGPQAFVVGPALPYPLRILGVHLAVNEDGVMMVYQCHHEESPEPNRYTVLNSTPVPAEVLALLRNLCASLDIRGGLHHAQLVELDGAWRLMDWNPRPTVNTGLLYAEDPGFADHGLAHMMGVPYAGPVSATWSKVFA